MKNLQRVTKNPRNNKLENEDVDHGRKLKGEKVIAGKWQNGNKSICTD